MAHPIFIVDAFAMKPFGGNPAAVVLLDEDAMDPSDAYLLAVAREMNLSETAFIAPRPGDLHGHFGLRWFTPVREVDLCGHATLASAQVLYDNGKVDLHTPLIFHTRSGLLEARPFVGEPGSFAESHRGGVGVKLMFPADAARPSNLPHGMLDAMGLPLTDIIFTGRGEKERQFDYLIEVGSEDVVRNLKPDFKQTASLMSGESRGVIVSAVGTGEYDVVSRFFLPTYGINEDPVTGSAHTLIGPYFSKKIGKETLRCQQASARGGEMLVTIGGRTVELAGRAVTVVRGQLAIEKV